MKPHRMLGAVVAALSLLAFASPAAADSRIEKDLALQPGGEFILESEVGGVAVRGTSRSGAHIVITSPRDNLDSELEITFTNTPGMASVAARRKHNSLWSQGISVEFEVDVPAETRTQIRTGGGSIELSGLKGSATVKTSGGPIEITGLVGNLEAFTSGGPIHVKEVTGDTHLGTSGGPIDAEAVDGALNAHTSGGGIRIDRVSGYVEAKTSGGPIHVKYSPGNRHGGVLESSGGSIDVAIDPSANLNLNASTSGGNVSSDIPVRVAGTVSHSRMQGSIGSGGEELRLHTSGGSIRIRAL